MSEQTPWEDLRPADQRGIMVVALLSFSFGLLVALLIVLVATSV